MQTDELKDFCRQSSLMLFPRDRQEIGGSGVDLPAKISANSALLHKALVITVLMCLDGSCWTL